MRVKLTVSYDGTDFCGWQVQDNGVSVQGVLEEAIFKVTGENVRVTGSGRTDAGVHAAGQVAHFDTESSVPAEKFYKALNVFLPGSVKVIKSEEADADVEKMKAAAKEFVGTHDFSAYKASGSSAKTTVRKIYSCKVVKKGTDITFTVCGNGFLYNMVRIMVGATVAAGRGEISVEDIRRSLATGERPKNVKTFPAKGLCLISAEYSPQKNRRKQK